MTPSRAANAYRKIDLESAPKPQILERLLERLLADLATARAAIVQRDIEGKAHALSHAKQILVQLKVSLDPSVAPELCANLARLYDYANERINTANLKMSVAALDDAKRVLGAVSEAFLGGRER
jgi:flagellar biosynthetic protein FliS